MGEDLETQERRIGVRSSRFLLQQLKQDFEAYALVVRVTKSRRVSRMALLGGRRGSNQVVLARQLAMYLLHVLLARPQLDVARLFGRPRSTVTYACRAIEWLRDRDELLDDEIARIETQGWGEAGESEAELRHAA